MKRFVGKLTYSRTGMAGFVALLSAVALVLTVAEAEAGGVTKPAGATKHHQVKARHPRKKAERPKGQAARLAALRVEAEALEGRITTLKAAEAKVAARPALITTPAPTPSIAPASGPAGGVLTGTYPEPRLGIGSVDGAALQSGAVGTAQIAPETIPSQDLADASVGTEAIRGGSIGAEKMAMHSIGFEQLAETFAWPQPHEPANQLTLKPGGPAESVTVTCPEGRLISGGWVWSNESGQGTEIMKSAPAEADFTWEIVAKVEAGGDENTIKPFALCLAD